MPSKRHVLLLFTDQQRWDTIHALGSQSAITPNLDRLAREADVFNFCYTPSPVCAPARLSLYSGLYPAKHGSSNNSPNILYKEDGFYGMLTEAGYNTCAIGKMHFIHDKYGLHGFKRRITQEELPDSRDDYTNFLLNTEYNYVIDYNGERSEMYYIPQISQLPQKYHPTQWIGDQTVEFIKEADLEEPMFLVSSFIHPHPPFAPPVPWNKIHRQEMYEAFVPENSGELISYHNYGQNAYKGLSAGVDRHLVTQIKNYYYDCITFVDYQIGRIIETLKEKGIYEDTMIIFASDHGELLGDYNCLGKRCMLDAAARIPMLIRNPAGSSTHVKEVCSLLDLGPTILRYAGIEPGAGFEGKDLYAGNLEREFVYSQYSNGTIGLYMIVSSRDKLIYSAADGKYWYFNEFPEHENRYREDDPRCATMRELLWDYIDSDQALDKETQTVDMDQVRKAYRYKLVRQDSVMRMKDEQAMLPEGYHLELELEYTWAKKK